MNTKSTCRLVKYFEFCEYKKYMSSGKIFFYECIASMFHCGVNEVKLQQIRGVGMITPSFTKYSSFLECRLVGRIMHACAFLNQSLYRYVVKNNVIGPSAIPYHILTAT